jgi:hypothetical protein
VQPLEGIAPVFVINLLIEQLHRHNFIDEYSGAFGCGVGHGLREVIELELLASTITQFSGDCVTRRLPSPLTGRGIMVG